MAAITYELWDLEAGNLIGSYADEAGALAQVRRGVDAGGAELWREVGMLRIGEAPEDAERVATGDDLIALAFERRQIDTWTPPTSPAPTEDRPTELPSGDLNGFSMHIRGDVRISAIGGRVVVEVDPEQGDRVTDATDPLPAERLPRRH